jgi:hypothetical protein
MNKTLTFRIATAVRLAASRYATADVAGPEREKEGGREGGRERGRERREGEREPQRGRGVSQKGASSSMMTFII